MNAGAALREFLLEGLLVTGELGGIGIGSRLVGVNGVVSGCADGAIAGGYGSACLVKVAGDVGIAMDSGYGGDRADGGSVDMGGCLVEVNAITADVDAVVALAVAFASASAPVVIVASTVVVALIATVLGVAVIPAGVFAVPVLS